MTIGQGNSSLGLKGDNESDDQNRTIIITVTAISDFNSSESLNMTVGNFEFLEDYVQSYAATYSFNLSIKIYVPVLTLTLLSSFIFCLIW